MKEDNGNQDVGATAFDYPNSQNPRPHFQAYYGRTPVPHPTNSAAKVVNPARVMNEVNNAE
jgi:hypothetical protein